MDAHAALASLIGESSVVRELRARLRQALEIETRARRLPPLLVEGETGTGKGLLARAIHDASSRASGPFVAVNCAAIPETMLEAELFGYERGAFTDARQAKPGLFQCAQAGTLFLDEIGLLSMVAQGKLLTAIAERSVRRLGSARAETVDVLLVAASNVDLAGAVDRGLFREDLYHRLAVLRFELPPLRERGHDVILLARHFLERACQDYGLGPRRFSAEALGALGAHSWPGNVRELANVVERAALLADSPTLGIDLLGSIPAAPRRVEGRGASDEESLEGVVRGHLESVLRETGGNISRTARRLGLARNTVRARMRRYGLQAGERPGRAAREADSAPEREEARRTLFLLHADVGAGGDGAIAPDHRHREAVVAKMVAFGGRVETAGPRHVLAVFGLDPAEDIGRRAALCAMAIAAAAVRVRLVEGDGASPAIAVHRALLRVGRLESAVMLDGEEAERAGAHVAALARAARAGSIVVGDETRRVLARHFEFVRPEGSRGAWRLEGLRRDVLASAALPEFVGRADESSFLAARWRAAMTGHGQVVGLAGEPGIGKTRLLGEFRRRLERRPGRYLEARCLSYRTTSPYFAVTEILHQLCGTRDGDLAAVVEAGARQLLTAAGLDESGAPDLLYLLGRLDGAGRGPDLPAEIRVRRALDVLLEAILGASRRAPLLIAVEDLHWIDDSSERFFGRLAETVARAPILLVTAYRPGYRPPWATATFASTVSLPPLGEIEARRLIRSVLGGAAAGAGVEDTILARAGGNPFFLEELAHAAGEPGSGPRAVPDSVHDVLRGRIDRLGDDPRSVLEGAAVIGPEVARGVLDRVTELSEARVAAALGSLVGGAFLARRPGPDEVYCFRHALTHEIAYGAIPEGGRRDLHRAVARALAALEPDRLVERAELLAHHAVRGELWDAAVDHLRRAGGHAAWRGAFEDSLARYEEALAALGRLPESVGNVGRGIDLRLDMHVPLAMRGHLGRLVDVQVECERLAREIDDRGRLGAVLARMAQYAWLTGRHADGVRHARAAIEVAEQTGARPVILSASFALGVSQHALGHYRAAVAAHTRVTDGPDVELARRLVVVGITAYAGTCAWLAQSLAHLGELDRALQYSRRAGEAAAASAQPLARGIAATLGAFVLAYRGELPEAVDQARSARDLYRQLGIVLSETGAAAVLGWCLVQTGEIEEGLAHLAHAVTQKLSIGHRMHLSLMLAWWAEGLLVAGEIEAAREKALAAVRVAVELGERGNEAEARLVLGRAVAAGVPAEGETAPAILARAATIAGELEMRPLLARCWAAQGDEARRAGRIEEGRRLLEGAGRQFGAMGARHWLAEVDARLVSVGPATPPSPVPSGD